MPATITNPTAPATEAQLGLIDRLMQQKLNETERSATYKRLSDGIDKGTASTWITALMAKDDLPKPASDKQLVFIAKLVDEKLEGDEHNDVLARIDRREYTGGRNGTASALIDRLMALPKLGKAAQSQADLPSADVLPAGRYAIENADGVLTFYHIRRNRNNGKVAIAVKAGPAEHDVPFTSAGYKTIMESIIAAGPKDCSIRFGKELGCCGVCGADLTSEWRLQGIGPICSQRF